MTRTKNETENEKEREKLTENSENAEDDGDDRVEAAAVCDGSCLAVVVLPVGVAATHGDLDGCGAGTAGWVASVLHHHHQVIQRVILVEVPMTHSDVGSVVWLAGKQSAE